MSEGIALQITTYLAMYWIGMLGVVIPMAMVRRWIL